ncbi:MAG: Aromatic-ring-opening dioxygenase LigAB, LigA subunit [Acidobacteriota bacterium]|jgi:hypothetical protein|nr:Aromatic-ring-opening dioxygenase LigAB, LigA subunit [Acidobacteriota bacterium]
MASQLINLLLDLGSDPKNLESIKKDPEAYLKRYHLSDEETAAVEKSLRTRDPKYIQKLIPKNVLSKHNNVQVNIL